MVGAGAGVDGSPGIVVEVVVDVIGLAVRSSVVPVSLEADSPATGISGSPGIVVEAGVDVPGDGRAPNSSFSDEAAQEHPAADRLRPTVPTARTSTPITIRMAPRRQRRERCAGRRYGRVCVMWIVDGNNVFGSRPDGWWNDRDAASRRLAQRIADWCRGHDDDVTLVFDGPLAADTTLLAGGNLRIVEATRRGRDAADDDIADLADDHVVAGHDEIRVVTSDRGLRRRLPAEAEVIGVGRFRELIGY